MGPAVVRWAGGIYRKLPKSVNVSNPSGAGIQHFCKFLAIVKDHSSVEKTSPLAELIGNPSIRAPKLRHLGYNVAVPGGSTERLQNWYTVKMQFN